MSGGPISKVLVALDSVTHYEPRQNGHGWQARCPAHDDRRASLSIAEGDDGRALLHCHRGCTVEAIATALGLTLVDLMPSNIRPTASRRHANKTPTRKVYARARDAVAQLERQHGKRSALWTYQDAEGETVGLVIRWNRRDGGKDIRPVSRNGNGWVTGAMAKPRPLYALPELLARPDERVYITEGDIDPATEVAIEDIFARLYELQPATDGDGEFRPTIVKMTAAGKAAWVKFFNAHAVEHAELTGELSAAWSKLEGYAARLALVVPFIRRAVDDPTLADPGAVDEASITAGAALSRWFGHETRRVYSILSESDDDRERRRLLELMRRKGEKLTVRELQQSSRLYATAADAEKALDELGKAGVGRWEDRAPRAKGGRPTRVFRLDEASAVYETSANLRESDSPVDVDSVDTLADDAGQTGGDEWGEL